MRYTLPLLLAGCFATPALATPLFSVTCGSTVEGGVVAGTIIKNAASSSYSTIFVYTLDGKARAGIDYKYMGALYTIATSSLSQTFAVQTYDNNLADGTRYLRVTIMALRNGVVIQKTAVCTIFDNDTVVPPPGPIQPPPFPPPPVPPPLPGPAPTFSVADVSVSESGGSAVVHIAKSGGNGLTSMVDYSAYSKSGDTATANVDYTTVSGSLMFLDLETDKTVSVPIINDSAVESDETFSFDIVGSNNATITNSGHVTITNDDVPSPPPSPPPPPPPPAPIDPPGSANNPIVGQSPGVGAPDIATTDHSVSDDLKTSPIPGTAAPDVVGAFRFICKSTGVKNDDHVAKYQQPGTSHAHDNTGHRDWDANSNYGNLRATGGSECNDVEGADGTATKRTHAANRTSYLQPALLDGKGHVIRADDVVFYYKRRPQSDPKCTLGNFQAQGNCVILPNGLKFLFGNHPDNPSLPFDSTNTKYMCTSNNTEYGSNMLAALTACQGTSGQFEVRTVAPQCWNGTNLDSNDHRSHMAYAGYGTWGYLKCPADHPYVIPTFTYAAQYTIASTDDVSLIHFSSDEMDNTKPRGWSFHVDYGPAAWDPTVLAEWTDHCINELLNCSSGVLGDGKQLKGAAEPIYLIIGQYVPLWRNPNRLTPVP